MGLKFWILFGFFLTSCAQIQPLTGGNKDETAPVPLMNQAIPVFASTSVKPKLIVIPFNEYIKLNNPNTNISITPEIGTKPKFEVKGRDLHILLEPNELLDNTTYSLVFNKALADINEGNDTTFTYVFSTGPSIDSLTYSAFVLDNEAQTPVANAIVGLYVPSDSLNPYKDKPKYVAQTDKNGLATFNFLAAQQLVVFTHWNKEGEKINPSSSIAFLDAPISLDTIRRIDTLNLFQPIIQVDRGRILRKELSTSGRIELVTNFEINPSELNLRKDDQKLEFLYEKTERSDSSFLWVNLQENSTYTVSHPFLDTVITAKISTRKLSKSPIKFSTNLKANELEIFDTLTVTFDVPIKKVDIDQIRIFESDSIEQQFSYQVINWRQLKIVTPSNTNRVNLSPGSIKFFNDESLKDTIDMKFSRKTEKKYANLELTMVNKPASQLLLRLYSGGEIKSMKIIEKSDSLVVFPMLSPGEYLLQVIQDQNENGIFDTGNYAERRQPEPVIWFKTAITLRANWDTKQTVEFTK